MSHVSVIKAHIKDLTCLGIAAEYLGMEFDQHATLFKYFNNSKKKCDGVLRIKDNTRAFEMGVQKNKQSEYDLLWDSYGGGNGLVSVVGQNAERLTQEYSVAVACRQAARQGMRIQRSTNAQGNVVIIAE